MRMGQPLDVQQFEGIPRGRRGGRVPSPYPPTRLQSPTNFRLPGSGIPVPVAERECNLCRRTLVYITGQAIKMADEIKNRHNVQDRTHLLNELYDRLVSTSPWTTGGGSASTNTCPLCALPLTQLTGRALQAMVQSLGGTEVSPPPRTYSHHTHVHHHTHRTQGVNRTPVSRIPSPLAGPSYRQHHLQHQSRIPSPMPGVRTYSPVPGQRRMSGRPPPANSVGSTSGVGSGTGKTTAGTLNPVAQQAQQYLEQNIQAWMQPKPQAPQLFSGSLTTMVASSGSSAPYCRGNLNGLSPSSSNSSGGGHGVPQDGGLQLRQPRAGAAGFYPMLPLSTSFPHSLSLSGYSPTSVLQGTSFSSPCASSGGTYAVTQQPSAAASFFARAAQRLNLSSKKRRRHGSSSEPEPIPFKTNFADILRTAPPPAPPALLRAAGRKDAGGLGKVKVMLRICPSLTGQGESSSAASFLTVDSRKRQVALADPSLTSTAATPADRRAGVSAPKMFAFDAIFSQDDTQTEVCSSSLTDVIQAVVNGTDGCLFVYGHSKLGKSYTMTGGSGSTGELGVIPCAISWLFRLINEHKQRTGARFSVRVSAVEITGRTESLKDLLSEHANGTEGSGPSPAVYLRDDPVFGTRLMNQTELRAPTADKAAFLLDAAIAARTTPESEDENRNSHFLFTLHVYQYRVEKGSKGGVAGGRSRLHLFDLGSCEKPSKAGRAETGTGAALTLSALGNVVLALFNGQKHVPYKDSKVTQVLREALGSLTCRAAMIAHVSAEPAHYAETLATVQLASRVHRIRRKKFKYMGVGTSDDDRGLSRPFVRSLAVSSEEGVKSGSSDPDYTSSSEQSCDTVIYVGAAGLPLHDRDLTDNESPPALLPLQVSAEEAPAKSALTSAPSGSSAGVNRTPVKAAPVPKPEVKTEVSSSKETQAVSAATSGVRKVSTKRSQPSGTKPIAAVVGEPVASLTPQGNTSIAAKQANALANAKPKSDELWIDGPRFYKPKFDSRTLHQLAKEQWVDGPAVNYGYMDDHKQDMIRKWVEEHSRHVQDKLDRSKIKEVWIDFPGRTMPVSPSTPKKDSKRRQQSSSSSVPVAPMVTAITSATVPDNTELSKVALAEDDAAEEDSAADSASTTADLDEADYEMEHQDSLFEKELEEALGDVDSSLSRHVVMEYAESDDDQPPETIEVMEPDEPVQMQDSCLQVNEEDIMAACWMLEGGALAQATLGRENPLPEVDQESFKSGKHPLHVLSREDLNLASSFTDSRSVSVDLDNVGVPDDPGLAWKYLRGQLQAPRIRESSAMKGDQLAQRLERIAKLREISVGSAMRFSDRASDDLNVSKTSGGMGLPARTARLTMSDMLFGGSRDSSLDDLMEDVTSIHSEPAELDFDRCDYKFNVKPMNGLKLEAFYNKLYNTTSFLDHALQSKGSVGLTGSLRGRGSASTTCFAVPKLESYQKILPSSPQLSSAKHKAQHRTSTGHLAETTSEDDKTKRNSLDLQKRNSITSLRHPDGASNPHLNKHPSMTQLQVEVRTASPSKQVTPPQRSPGNGASGSDVEERRSISMEAGPTEKLLLTPGPSPTAKMSRLSRLLGRNCGPPDKSKCKDGSPKHCRSSPKGSPKMSHKQPQPVPCPAAKHIAYEPVWIPSRGSPASSSTGAPTMCCNSGKASRTKPSCKPSLTKHCSPKADKQRKTNGCDKKSKSKPLQRSTSSPVPSSDEKEDVIRCDEDLECVGGKGCPGRRPSGLPSPYSLITKARLAHPSSSGHGSDSSVNSGEQGKEPLIGKACTKGPQCSGTSSGYESILRDSEGTPLSSSSQNSECEDLDREGGRGRKGKRKKTQGSAKRSRSAPARVPNEAANVATGGGRRSPVDSQPVSARSRHLQHWGNGRLRTSEEEVCCTGLLCCRLLDFY